MIRLPQTLLAPFSQQPHIAVKKLDAAKITTTLD
jgi:hypothetical protein